MRSSDWGSDVCSSVLSAAVRPPSATKARLGGDEFVAMLAFEPAARADIDVLAGQLVAALETPVASDAQQIRIAGSLGIALADHAGATLETRVCQSDISIYPSKEKGRKPAIRHETRPEMALLVLHKPKHGIHTRLPPRPVTPLSSPT